MTASRLASNCLEAVSNLPCNGKGFNCCLLKLMFEYIDRLQILRAVFESFLGHEIITLTENKRDEDRLIYKQTDKDSNRKNIWFL